MIRLSTIIIIVGLILFIVFSSSSIGALQVASNSPQYLPDVETVYPSGTSQYPSVLTSPTFTASVNLLEESIYGNTATQSDVVIGTVVVTSVVIMVDGTSYSPSLSTNPSQFGTQYWYNQTITLPTTSFVGPITYAVTYYDNMNTGATSSATSDWGGYISLNSAQVSAPSITGTWTIDGVVISSTTTTTLNITNPLVSFYYFPTTNQSYIASTFIRITPINGGSQANVGMTKESNGSYYATYTLPAFGSYNAIGFVNTTYGGVEAMYLFGSYGALTAPHVSLPFSQYYFPLFILGFVLLVVGVFIRIRWGV